MGKKRKESLVLSYRVDTSTIEKPFDLPLRLHAVGDIAKVQKDLNAIEPLSDLRIEVNPLLDDNKNDFSFGVKADFKPASISTDLDLKETLELRRLLDSLVQSLTQLDDRSDADKLLEKPIASISPKEHIVYIIRLASDDEYPSVQLLNSIVSEIKKISEDDSIKLLSISRGSVLLELEGTEDGYDRLVDLIRSSGIEHLLGCRILGIRMERRVPWKEEAKHQHKDSLHDQNILSSIAAGYSSSKTRKLLGMILRTDSMLEAFILDHFPQVKKSITSTMDRIHKVSLLLEMEDKERIIDFLNREFPLDFEKYSRELEHFSDTTKSS